MVLGHYSFRFKEIGFSHNPREGTTRALKTRVAIQALS